MKVHPRQKPQAGSTLLLVLVFALVGLMLLGSVLSWTGNQNILVQRRAQFQGSVAAAEAATELAVGRMAQDFQNAGATTLDNNLASYATVAPQGLPATYVFSSPGGGANPLSVQRLSNWSCGPVGSALAGLRGNVATYQVASRAQPAAGLVRPLTQVKQEIQFASIPVFQFELFYASDLELTPSANWQITGRVHANGTIYCEPAQASLTFMEPVTAAGAILHRKNPLDPVVRTPGTIAYSAGSLAGVKSLLLPVGTNNSPDALHALLEVPPTSESTNSALSQQRYYNKADLIILVSDTSAVAMSGAYNHFATVIPWSNVGTSKTRTGTKTASKGFVNTSLSFYDAREGKTMSVTQVDLAAFAANYAYLQSVLGRPVKVLYVADLRTAAASAVRLVNGQTLPAAGLTIATPNPLYVQGHFNAPATALGTTNTTGTVPASLVCDAITCLSVSWSDANSTRTISSRVASDTTVNAAVLTGIVPTGGGYYSGGADNAIRFLEDWTGKTLTFNGSLVVLFDSRLATGPWGTSTQVSTPPNRRYNFDPNFLESLKLPPGTPELRASFRTKYSAEAAPSS
jgi:hypothetical protein